jgi:hypothetical protein
MCGGVLTPCKCNEIPSSNDEPSQDGLDFAGQASKPDAHDGSSTPTVLRQPHRRSPVLTSRPRSIDKDSLAEFCPAISEMMTGRRTSLWAPYGGKARCGRVIQKGNRAVGVRKKGVLPFQVKGVALLDLSGSTMPFLPLEDKDKHTKIMFVR